MNKFLSHVFKTATLPPQRKRPMSAYNFAAMIDSLSEEQVDFAQHNELDGHIKTCEERELTAETIQEDVHFLLQTGLRECLTCFPLEREDKETIEVFSLGKYTNCPHDMFSITCEPTMTHLNLRVYNPPPLGQIMKLEDEDLLTLELLHGEAPYTGVQRKGTDEQGRTVIQFVFAVECNSVDLIMAVIEGILICFPGLDI
jgi:hypothetical protein